MSSGLDIIELLDLEIGEDFQLVTLAADPAVGAEVAVTVPGRAVWELHTLRLQLVTDATVSNRQVTVEVDDGTSTFFAIGAPSTQGASLTRQYNYGAYGSDTGGGFSPTDLALGIPPLVLLPGFRVRTNTTNLQAGDNYARPVLYVREISRRGERAALSFELVEGLRRLIPLLEQERATGSGF